MRYQFYYINSEGGKEKAEEHTSDRLLAEAKERQLNQQPGKKYWFEEERTEDDD